MVEGLLLTTGLIHATRGESHSITKRDEHVLMVALDWFDFEVKGDERENETLQILHEIIEDTESFRVLTVLDIHQGPDFGSLESDVVISNTDFKLLLANNVLFGPVCVVFLCDLAGLDDALKLLHH